MTERKSKGMLAAMAAKALDIKADSVLSCDLFVENCEKAVLAGAEDEMVMAPRFDDLACVFAGLKGIAGKRSERYIDVFAVFDNEEVGSLTRQGADSTFSGTRWKISRTGWVSAQTSAAHGRRTASCSALTTGTRATRIREERQI